jgi:hypothetical protein
MASGEFIISINSYIAAEFYNTRAKHAFKLNIWMGGTHILHHGHVVKSLILLRLCTGAPVYTGCSMIYSVLWSLKWSIPRRCVIDCTRSKLHWSVLNEGQATVGWGRWDHGRRCRTLRNHWAYDNWTNIRSMNSTIWRVTLICCLHASAVLGVETILYGASDGCIHVAPLNGRSCSFTAIHLQGADRDLHLWKCTTSGARLLIKAVPITLCRAQLFRTCDCDQLYMGHWFQVLHDTIRRIEWIELTWCERWQCRSCVCGAPNPLYASVF